MKDEIIRIEKFTDTLTGDVDVKASISARFRISGMEIAHQQSIDMVKMCERRAVRTLKCAILGDAERAWNTIRAIMSRIEFESKQQAVCGFASGSLPRLLEELAAAEVEMSKAVSTMPQEKSEKEAADEWYRTNVFDPSVLSPEMRRKG